MVLASKTKTPSIHHKKRNGQHHKPTKTYHKTYWPYLPLIAIVILGIAANSLWSQVTHGVLGYATNMSATELLADTNMNRAASDEAALHLNTALDNAAQAKANSMVTLNYWSHDTPSGQPPWVFINAAGYNYSVAGENLAYGFNASQDVLTAWMGSPEHRANILNTTYKDVGFGIANSTDYQNNGPETVVVAEYGAPAATVASTAQSTQSTSTNTIPTSVTPDAKPTEPTSAIQPQASPTSTPVALNATPVSRLQLATNNSAPFSAFAISILALACLFILFVRHGLLWRQALRTSEAFIVNYHALDILFVAIGVLGFLVTRNVGYIH